MVALVADSVDLGHLVAQEGVLRDESEDLVDVAEERLALAAVPCVIEEVGLFAEARREHVVEVGVVASKRLEALEETQHHVLGAHLRAGQRIRRAAGRA